MPIVPIDDIDDPRLAIYRQIKANNDTRDSGLFVLEGEKLLDRLLESPQFPVSSAVATLDRAPRIAHKLDLNTPLYVLEESHVSALVGYRYHLGVLSAGVRREWHDPLTYCAERIRTRGRLTLVLCPSVNDPENLGSIARTGDTFGIDGILAGPGCPDPFSRRVLRVSMGAVLRLPIWCDLAIIDHLRAAHGLRLVAASTGPNSLAVHQFQRPSALGLVLGNEAQGVSAAWLARCDYHVTIPMRPGADSLNVAVAAGILLHRLS